LPGTYVGVLLGGAGPLQAGITQVLVLIGRLAAAAISVLVTVQLVAAGLVSRVAPRDVRCR
jgi:putative ABC transport system permease protein